MGVRGRKSSASLSVAVTNMPGQRPEPPEKLSECQKEEWRAVVGRMPANWFTRENEALLIEHCRHVERSDELEKLIQGALAAGEIREAAEFLKLAKSESEILCKLATKMRLSQQARWDAQNSKTAIRHEVNGTRPWQRTG